MKKKDIVDAINKNLEVLKYEELYYIGNNAKVGNTYIEDLIGVKPVEFYYEIERMYNKLNIKGCDCKLFIHHEAPEEEFESDYDECILCHQEYSEPKRETIWFQRCKDDKPFGRYDTNADIKYKIFKYILDYVKDYEDEADIDLYKVIKDYLKEKDYYLHQANYFIDSRKKDYYKMLIVLGSNEIQIGNIITKPIAIRGVSSLVGELLEDYNIKIDVLKSDGYDSHYMNSNTTTYEYKTIGDVDTFFERINEENVKYDLVLDFSNLKSVEEVNGRLLLEDYQVKDKVNADYYITLRDSGNMDAESILADSDNHDKNEKVIYREYKNPYGNLGGFQYVKDGEVRETSCLYPLSRLVLDTLLDETKVSLDEKKEISKELVRTLKKTM